MSHSTDLHPRQLEAAVAPPASSTTTLAAPGRPRPMVRVEVRTAAASHPWPVRLAWAAQCLTATVVARAAWAEQDLHHPHASLFAALEWLLGGASRHNLALAVFGLVLAVAVLDIDTAGIAAMLLSLVSAGAVITLALERQNIGIPLVACAATAVIIWQRRDELCEYVRYACGARLHRLHMLCPEDDLPPAKRRALRDSDAALD